MNAYLAKAMEGPVTVRIAVTTAMLAALFSAGETVSAETYTYKGAAYMQQVERAKKERAAREAAKRPLAEEEIEYRALVEPKEESRLARQPGDVAVQWNGPKMKISLGL